MSLIGSIGNLTPSPLQRLPGTQRTDALAPGIQALAPKSLAGLEATPTAGFGKIFEQLVNTVEAKQSDAANITKSVLLGQEGQLHQSVISMQEASVAFSLMVEVRNKLVESYQELMRMPV